MKKYLYELFELLFIAPLIICLCLVSLLLSSIKNKLAAQFPNLFIYSPETNNTHFVFFTSSSRYLKKRLMQKSMPLSPDTSSG